MSTHLTFLFLAFAVGWGLVIISLSIMWPLAMYTYKTVNKLRLYMMNKIINLEPCVDKSSLYGLSRLPRGKMNACSDKGIDNGNEFMIMIDGGRKSVRGSRGMWNSDEVSAISSLSGGDGRHGLRRII